MTAPKVVTTGQPVVGHIHENGTTVTVGTFRPLDNDTVLVSLSQLYNFIRSVSELVRDHVCVCMCVCVCVCVCAVSYTHLTLPTSVYV